MPRGRTRGVVGEEDGYSAEADAAILLQAWTSPMSCTNVRWVNSGRTESARAIGAGTIRTSAGPTTRRTYEHLDLDSIHGCQSFPERL